VPLQGGNLRAALDGPQGARYKWHERGTGIAADIARGLAYIHTTGVVHRSDATCPDVIVRRLSMGHVNLLLPAHLLDRCQCVCGC
jgi:serine/threonine protein kinase